MDTEAMLITLESDSRVSEVLDRIARQLDTATGELALDLSHVGRIDSAGLQALEDLVKCAEEKSVKVTLHGTNVGVYKVLKLVKLTERLSFMS